MITAKHPNYRRHPYDTKKRARMLRKSGLTHRELAQELGISLGSAHLWTLNIHPTPEQRRAIWKRYAAKVYTTQRRHQLGVNARKTLAPFWIRPYSRKELLSKIQSFYKKHQRIPLKREFNQYRQYQKEFGNWNSAIRAAGFTPNLVVFSQRLAAKDGHICDSFSEKIIDDLLFKCHIAHERHVRYGKTKMTADFSIGDARIEFFGLHGEMREYDQIIKRKRNFCKRTGLRLIELYPEKLFSKKFNRTLRLILTMLQTTPVKVI